MDFNNKRSRRQTFLLTDREMYNVRKAAQDLQTPPSILTPVVEVSEVPVKKDKGPKSKIYKIVFTEFIKQGVAKDFET